jgi:hypothetical protein
VAQAGAPAASLARTPACDSTAGTAAGAGGTTPTASEIAAAQAAAVAQLDASIARTGAAVAAGEAVLGLLDMNIAGLQQLGAQHAACAEQLAGQLAQSRPAPAGKAAGATPATPAVVQPQAEAGPFSPWWGRYAVPGAAAPAAQPEHPEQPGLLGLVVAETAASQQALPGSRQQQERRAGRPAGSPQQLAAAIATGSAQQLPARLMEGSAGMGADEQRQ